MLFNYPHRLKPKIILID